MNRHQELLAAAKRHFEADILLPQAYGTGENESFRGCSVGCLLRDIYPHKAGAEIGAISDKHSVVANYYAYPTWLAHLQDIVFEGLPKGESAIWHVQLAEAIAALPEDYDWIPALHRVHLAILRIAARNAGSASEAVKAVIDLHERAGNGEDISDETWSAARQAASAAALEIAKSGEGPSSWSMAWAGAESAAWLASRSAAWSAGRTAEGSASRSAAWSAARSAAFSASKSAAYQEIRDGVLAALTEGG